MHHTTIVRDLKELINMMFKLKTTTKSDTNPNPDRKSIKFQTPFNCRKHFR